MGTAQRILRLAQKEEQDLALASLYDYCEKAIENPFLAERPHREMCDFFESALPPKPDEMRGATQKLSMFLGPRNIMKSSIGVNSLVEYFALKWKLHYGYDVRVGIGRASREGAGNALSGIRQDFEANPRIRAMLGEANWKTSRWTNYEMRLGWRTTVYREPTVATMGLDHAKTGDHYDLIIPDDLVTEVNWESPRVLEYARHYIEALMPLLEPWGSILYIGTRWSYNDPPGVILREETEREQNGTSRVWNIMVRSCYNDDGSSYCPTRLPLDNLTNLQNSMTPKLFAANYLNVVQPESEVVFKPEDILWFDGEYIHPDGEPATLRITSGTVAKDTELRVKPVLLCDTATTTSDQSDHSALILLLGDMWKRWWVWEAMKVRETPTMLLARMMRMIRVNDPEQVSVEVGGNNATLVDWLETQLREEKIHTSIYRYHPLTEAARMRQEKGAVSPIGKSNRIEFMERRFSNRSVFIKRGLSQLYTELTTYDGVRPRHHFDLLDALAQATTLDPYPVAYSFEQESEEKETQWHERIKALASRGHDTENREMVAGRWTGR